jgi:biotin-dependent carboxylase-like uncharacterized protein
METRPDSILRVLELGFGLSLQDRGRPGWRRFGLPLSGAMDPHAAGCANRLLDNASSCVVLELLGQGARLEVLQPGWFALCGAEVEGTLEPWRAQFLERGALIAVRRCRAGLWSYLAVPGGFAVASIFGSASYYARADVGERIESGSLLARTGTTAFRLPAGVAGRLVSWHERRDYKQPPPIRVYAGPQWKSFSLADRDRLLTAEWKVSSQSDRVGYRLEGPRLVPEPPEILSEPVRPGSIQVPEGGQPIITMADGPTVGGYPKIALVDDRDLPWVAQSAPGQALHFQLVA